MLDQLSDRLEKELDLANPPPTFYHTRWTYDGAICTLEHSISTHRTNHIPLCKCWWRLGNFRDSGMMVKEKLMGANNKSLDVCAERSWGLVTQ